MIAEYIFKTIKDNIPVIHDGSLYHVYPSTVPDGIEFDTAIIYTKLMGINRFSQIGTDIQLSCVSKTYAGAEQLSLDIVNLFRNKLYQAEGDVIFTGVKAITDLPFDRDSEYYMVAVTIYVKTTLAL